MSKSKQPQDYTVAAIVDEKEPPIIICEARHVDICEDPPEDKRKKKEMQGETGGNESSPVIKIINGDHNAQ